jgi:hypothetical protein
VRINLFIILIISILGLNLHAQAPDWQWATQAGGISSDTGKSIAIDENGNCYVTGNFSDAATFGSYSLTSSGNLDIYVAKIDQNGNWLRITQAGGISSDTGTSIAIDDNENCYVTGYFNDTAMFGSYSLTSNGDSDIFVGKIDNSGNWLWATRAGGINDDSGTSIVADDNGNCYVTGYFNDTAMFGSYSLTSNGDSDIFVGKIDNSGNWLWVTQAGGIDVEYFSAITIDDFGNSYVTGMFEETATFGYNSLTSSGYADIFVAKINNSGNWQWATQAGGSSPDIGKSIAIDGNGNCYVTGDFEGSAIFGSYSLTSNGAEDIFVAKMDENGNWIWAIRAGGLDFDNGRSITVDDADNCYVTGDFVGSVIFGSYFLISNGSKNIFVAKLDGNGNWVWVTQAEGMSIQFGSGIAIDDNANNYVIGEFYGTAIFGSHSLTCNNGSDIFVAKLENFTSVESELFPEKIKLSNYPNPFNPSTTFEFSIQNDSRVELSIYNIKGQKIKNLVNSELNQGLHSVFWNGDENSANSVSSGIYYYKLNVNGKTEVVKKCLLLK